jgi:hypothetical protein
MITLELSRNALLLLMRGMTMYKHVPFEGVAKPDLHGQNLAIFDATDRKLSAVIRAERNSAHAHEVSLVLEHPELALLGRVLQTDMDWCDAGDAKCVVTEYHCHFSAERKEVMLLLAKVLSYKGH